ncbi:hypothetical protein [Glycomyces sp. NPDC048151]|uniref:hypothetical protein n=1 Tax=Glycomyces sp. NPDC048151 TaxID=3364002 RepID=UPI00372016C2
MTPLVRSWRIPVDADLPRSRAIGQATTWLGALVTEAGFLLDGPPHWDVEDSDSPATVVMVATAPVMRAHASADWRRWASPIEREADRTAWRRRRGPGRRRMVDELAARGHAPAAIAGYLDIPVATVLLHDNDQLRPTVPEVGRGAH